MCGRCYAARAVRGVGNVLCVGLCRPVVCGVLGRAGCGCGGGGRDERYSLLVDAAQAAYLDAVDGQTDARVRSRLLLITRLLKRWQRGW